jgi:hypothetical protein
MIIYIWVANTRIIPCRGGVYVDTSSDHTTTDLYTGRASKRARLMISYKKEDTTMARYQLTQTEQGKRDILFTGTEQEVFEYIKAEADQLSYWTVGDNNPAGDTLYQSFMASIAEAQSLSDMYDPLASLDHGWWRLDIEEIGIKDLLTPNHVVDAYTGDYDMRAPTTLVFEVDGKRYHLKSDAFVWGDPFPPFDKEPWDFESIKEYELAKWAHEDVAQDFEFALAKEWERYWADDAHVQAAIDAADEDDIDED